LDIYDSKYERFQKLCKVNASYEACNLVKDFAKKKMTYFSSKP